MARLEVFKDLGGKYPWRLIAANGKKVATSGESFDSRSNALRAATNVRRLAPNAALLQPLLRPRRIPGRLPPR